MRALVSARVLVAACSSGSPPAPSNVPPTLAAPTAPTAAPTAPTAAPTDSQPTIAPSPTAVPSPLAAIGQIEELRSSTPRNEPGPDPLSGVQMVANADADFAFRLYHELTADNSENLFF